jgi:transcription antitermination factor NusA-like protein
VSGVVKRVDYGNITVDLQRAEGVIRRDETIPRESLRVNDRVRAYIFDVREEPRGPQIFLSRSHPQFMAKLFTQEVPEIYDNIIEIKAVARDPGQPRQDRGADPRQLDRPDRRLRRHARQPRPGRRAGAAGREGRHHPVVAEPANFIVNALAPAEVSKVLMDEEKNKTEVVVPDDQLSLAIGRRGQNVKLASQLTGWEIDIMTEAEESERRQKETRERTELFKEALDVDDVIAHLLVAEGLRRGRGRVPDLRDRGPAGRSRASTRHRHRAAAAAPASSSSVAMRADVPPRRCWGCRGPCRRRGFSPCDAGGAGRAGRKTARRPWPILLPTNCARSSARLPGCRPPPTPHHEGAGALVPARGNRSGVEAKA